MELSKEKTMKIIEQYLKQRAYAKIYYHDYQQKNKEKINAYNTVLLFLFVSNIVR